MNYRQLYKTYSRYSGGADALVSKYNTNHSPEYPITLEEMYIFHDISNPSDFMSTILCACWW